MSFEIKNIDRGYLKMKKYFAFGAATVMSLAILAGCSSEGSKTEETKTEATEKATQTISYLGENYEVPKKVETIIAASLEAMEDAAVLGVKPTGVISSGGPDIPAYLATELEGATVVGDKMGPDAETMLKLAPDVILGTSKFDEEKMAKYNKVATTFPYTFLADKWEDNLKLMGQLTGKEAQAEQVIADYKKDAEAVKAEVETKFKDETALVIRVRSAMNTYGPNLYLSPQVYQDFGFKVPEQIADQKNQTELTQETLAEIDPDVIFLQFGETENAENPGLLDEILENEIFKNLKASKEDKVFVNIVDPLAQGGASWSKIKFLEAVQTEVLK